MADVTVRGRVVVATTVLAFALLWTRLIYLQVIDHGYYSRVADENRIQLAVDMARRGAIRDRNGEILAQNEPSYSVYLLRPKAVPLQSVAQSLARVLDLDSSAIMQKLRESVLPYYEPVRVARHITQEAVCRIEEQNEFLPGVLLRYESTRRYPESAGGSHMLGYLSEATGSTATTAAAGSIVGVRGIEQQYDTYMRGTDGISYLDVTAAGQIVGVSKDHAPTPSIPGAGVKLTIDWDLQRFAESLLADRGTGSVVCIDPRSGEVLALVNEPSFDGNLFSGILMPDVWNELVSDSTHPLLDRAVRGLYPPGSTSKLITAGAALETGVAAPNSRFAPCYGGMQFGNRFFRCWKPEGHGSLDMVGAIAQSCDVYFYQLGQKLGVERWAKYGRDCGFGRRTGIDLPDEAAGLVPDSAYYNRRYGDRKWSKFLILNLAIGQGEFLVTPLQLAQFYCAMANDGVAMRPTLLHSLLLEDADPIRQRPKESYRLPFSESSLRVLQEGLRAVIAGGHGTASALNYKDLAIAGKTGTAQNPHGKDHSWFACYAPFDNPQLVVAALVENAGHGSEVAAPICGEVMRFYFGLPSLKPKAPQPGPAAPGDSVRIVSRNTVAGRT
jgi:penicillin-binding protein 2